MSDQVFSVVTNACASVKIRLSDKAMFPFYFCFAELLLSRSDDLPQDDSLVTCWTNMLCVSHSGSGVVPDRAFRIGQVLRALLSPLNRFAIRTLLILTIIIISH